MGSDKALEVMGALASYRFDNRCPACDSQVVEAMLVTGDRWFTARGGAWEHRRPTHHICTVCSWSRPLDHIAVDYGASVSFTAEQIWGASGRG